MTYYPVGAPGLDDLTVDTFVPASSSINYIRLKIATEGTPDTVGVYIAAAMGDPHDDGDWTIQGTYNASGTMALTLPDGSTFTAHYAAPTGHTDDDVWISYLAGYDGLMKVEDASGNEKFRIETDGTPTFNNAYSLPVADGTANYVLQTNGSGTVGWAAMAAGSIPAGIIAMWSGTLATIPAGWALCDGTGGTPDLRSVFIKGTAAGTDPGGTGGSATHTHTFTPAGSVAAPVFTGDALAAHSHGVGTLAADNATITTSGPSGTAGGGAIPGACANAGHTHTNTHGHTVSGSTESVTAGTPSGTNSAPAFTGSGGTTAATSTDPSYYALAFIIKT